MRIEMKWKKTEQGYLITTAQIARIGELEYYGHEIGLSGSDSYKKVIIKRTKEALFSQKTIISFEGMPVTLLHPEEKEVNAKNWKTKTIGHTQNVREESDFLVCDVYIHDAAAIKVIEELGLREVSCGYDSEIVSVNGEFYQENIKGNHTAVVVEGRCGESCRLNDRKYKLMSLFKIIQKFKGAKIIDSTGEPLSEEELVQMIAALKQLEGKEDPETAQKMAEVAAQLSELKDELEKRKPSKRKPSANVNDDDTNSSSGSDEVNQLKAENEQLKAENEQLKAENEQLKKEIEELKGQKDLEKAFSDAKARFPKIKISDAKTARAVKEQILIGMGAFTDSQAKELTDEQVKAAYAAAQVTSKRQSRIGEAIMNDNKPSEMNLTQKFGGK